MQLRIFLIIVLLGLFKVSSAQSIGATISKLTGTWKWKQTDGGLLGGTVTPDSVGFQIHIIFMQLPADIGSDSISYFSYKNDSLFCQGKTNLTTCPGRLQYFPYRINANVICPLKVYSNEYNISALSDIMLWLSDCPSDGKTHIFEKDPLFLANVPGSVAVAILKLDNNTYNFEGANISYYPKCNVCNKDSLPFNVTYISPGDFGNITFKMDKTLDTIFDASIIWNGTGHISYPKIFNPYFKYSDIVRKPPIEYFYSYGKKAYGDSVFIRKADLAWDAIRSLEITNLFSKVNFKVGIYNYYPRVGIQDPSVAKWIIFLYADPVWTSANKIPVKAFEKIRCYPNPVSGTFYFEISKEDLINNSEISIFDLQGQLVLKQRITNLKSEINFGNRANGGYILRIINNNGVFVKKIIHE